MSRGGWTTTQPHGTIARYQSGCSCLTCCDGWAEYQRVRKAENTPRIVDAAPVRDHIRALTSHGMKRRAIAEMSGVHYNTVRWIHVGVSERCHRDTAEAILSLRGPLDSESTALIGAYQTLRLIARLRTEGHSTERIAAACGIKRGSLPQPGQRSVMAKNALRVKRAADALRGAAA